MATARWFTFDGEFTGPGADLPYDQPDPLLLDLLPSNTAYQAYSMRKLSLSYDGSAVLVRRASDNTTTDVGFAADGSFDSAALLAFADSGDVFVQTWYDQSGNNRDMSQATPTKQPIIVSAGAMVAVGGAPGVRFLGTNCHLKHTSPGIHSLVAATGMTMCQVHTDVAGTSQVSYGETNGSSSSGRILAFYWANSTPMLRRTQVWSDANANQSGYPEFTTVAAGEVHSDLITKANGPGSAAYRDGLLKVSNSWNPVMPTTLASATLGGWESGAGIISNPYSGEVGEHIILAGVVNSVDIDTITNSHVAYFGI